MPAFQAVYVATGSDDLTRDDVRRLGIGPLAQHSGSNWSKLVGALEPDPQDLQEAARNASTAIDGDAIAVLAHTATPYVEMSFYRKGKLTRHWRQDDDGWTVSGTPLDWESALFRGYEEFDEDAPKDDPTRRAVEERSLVTGAREPRVDLYEVLDAAALPTTFTSTSSATPRQLLILWLVGGLLILGLEGLFLERSSLVSTGILAVTLVVWIVGLNKLKKRNAGRAILR